MSKYQVVLTQKAKKLLTKIKARREQKLIVARLKKLQFEPEKQGKPLVKDLKGYYSLRVAGQRYRIIYRIEEEKIMVLIVAIGIRKQGDKQDIYEITKKIVSELKNQDFEL
ncbi:MAG: type II toxin-antitoxin system RelE/ParE family toxin [Gomphosphaeria aponina SAG 52.96 = DSM 107014]|uniref:Type II toxin-antitoxin system RelE/ParE family toxin n=1 Tax=Gomphosphaeria aponina SAG 52.96 = DSM 107014 TaxID=1521640 RepID=A0A941GWY6_9CHRO|nr:type II toxin-antitoxin system RelE/ParE family toxin [Gomphosphaeria aponina SAG 52.96 = DSM 107014]